MTIYLYFLAATSSALLQVRAFFDFCLSRAMMQSCQAAFPDIVRTLLSVLVRWTWLDSNLFNCDFS